MRRVHHRKRSGRRPKKDLARVSSSGEGRRGLDDIIEEDWRKTEEDLLMVISLGEDGRGLDGTAEEDWKKTQEEDIMRISPLREFRRGLDITIKED